jgi:DNA primase
MALLERFALVEGTRGATGASSRPFRHWQSAATPRTSLPAQLRISEEQVSGYHERLLAEGALLARLAELRLWTRAAVERLGLGWDGDRVTFPVRDAAGGLVGLARYQPDPARRTRAKLLADPGSRRDLFPAPETVGAGGLVLVEGEPDCIAAWSAGFVAVAIPGVWGWKRAFAERLAKHKVVLVFDADGQGRTAARRVAGELTEGGVSVRVLDLFPDRDDGSDLTDFLRGYGADELVGLLSKAVE